MAAIPAFLDSTRPQVPDLAVPRGVTPFYLPGQPVRGRLVRLGPLAATLLARHDHSPPVKALLGQALALAAALATALKFKGSFSVQARGDGPVPMLLADCTDSGALRGYARVDGEAAITPESTAGAMLGAGYLAFTVDFGLERDPQQGIVALEGGTLAAMAEHYFAQSEQLPARVFLAAAQTQAGWRASALVLERVAGAGGIAPDMPAAMQEEAWRTATILAETITGAELLDDALTPEHLLYRLFHGEGVAVAKPRPLSFGCRCSRARLSGILEGFPADDLDHMAVEGDIVMTCEFCNFDFRFPRDSIAGRPIQGMTPMKYLLLLLPVLVLAACAAPPPPETFKPLDYSYLRPIIFKAATLNVVNNYTPGPDETQLNANNPAPPAATLLAMLNQRMQPSGQPGTGTITVQAASITEANGMLNGQMTVDLNLSSADGRSTGFAEASVSASQTAPDSADQNATQAALYQMTKTLMDDINVQLPYQIAHNIPSWVAWTTPAAVQPGAATGGIQAAPLGAPGSSVTTTTATAPGAQVPPPTGNLIPPGYPGATP